MTAGKRLNSPLKRLSFLIMLTGIATLLVSFTLWSQHWRDTRLYYAKDHYDWVPLQQGSSGKTERFWSIDDYCVHPFAQARISELETAFLNHQKAAPEEPQRDLPLTASWREKATNYKRKKAYTDWVFEALALETKTKVAISTLAAFRGREFREGEIKRKIKTQATIPLMAWEPQGLNPGTDAGEDVKVEDERFRVELYSSLGLTAFPENQRDEIFSKCTTESSVEYALIRTTYHSDIHRWPSKHPTTVLVGLLLVVAGFFGSLGYGIVQGSLGRLYAWIRTGDASPSHSDKAPHDDNG